MKFFKMICLLTVLIGQIFALKRKNPSKKYVNVKCENKDTKKITNFQIQDSLNVGHFIKHLQTKFKSNSIFVYWGKSKAMVSPDVPFKTLSANYSQDNYLNCIYDTSLNAFG